MNRIKLYALGALAGLTTVVISALTVTASFNAAASSKSTEHISPLAHVVTYADTPRLIDGNSDSMALLPGSGEIESVLSTAADRLSPPKSGGISFSSSSTEGDSFVYFRQNSDEYRDIPYGNRTIGSYGCGPTNMAIVVTSITGRFVSPVTLARQSEEWGFFVSGAGTSLALFPKAAEYYGIKCRSFNYNKNEVISYLKQGKMIICTMGKGYFTQGGHFITLRGITDDGQILIADTYSESNTFDKAWTLDFLASQLKYSTMWVFSE